MDLCTMLLSTIGSPQSFQGALVVFLDVLDGKCMSGYPGFLTLHMPRAGI